MSSLPVSGSQVIMEMIGSLASVVVMLGNDLPAQVGVSITRLPVEC